MFTEDSLQCRWSFRANLHCVSRMVMTEITKVVQDWHWILGALYICPWKCSLTCARQEHGNHSIYEAPNSFCSDQTMILKTPATTWPLKGLQKRMMGLSLKKRWLAGIFSFLTCPYLKCSKWPIIYPMKSHWIPWLSPINPPEISMKSHEIP